MKTAYLVTHLVPGRSAEGVSGAVCKGFAIFSEPDPTCCDRGVNAVVLEGTGETYDDACKYIRSQAAQWWPWMEIHKR